jgi:hypothetical protein
MAPKSYVIVLNTAVKQVPESDPTYIHLTARLSCHVQPVQVDPDLRWMGIREYLSISTQPLDPDFPFSLFHMAWFIPGILLSLTCLVVWYNRDSKKHDPLPPGPPAEPLIGHLRLIPPVGQETLFYKWGKIYGNQVTLLCPQRCLMSPVIRRRYTPSLSWKIHYCIEQR